MVNALSPFPGMDPYIEACLWGDFHHHLIEEVNVYLAEAVPDRYVVRTGERSYLVIADAEGEKTHAFLPDVGVKSKGAGSSEAGTGVALTESAAEVEPVTMRAFVEEQYRETFVEIREAADSQRLVTCIEILSPTNKRRGSPGWDLYLRKRQGLLLGAANLVEIDLVTAGERMPMLDPWPDSPYVLLVARKFTAPSCRVWRAHYKSRLPSIPVPLHRPDPDIGLELQPMIDSIYTRFRYARTIDYAKPLTPPLQQEDAEWLRQRLAESRPQ